MMSINTFFLIIVLIKFVSISGFLHVSCHEHIAIGATKLFNNTRMNA